MHFAASQELADGSRFVFLGNEGNAFRFKLTSSGLSFNGFIPYPNAQAFIDLRAEMELFQYADGTFRLAAPHGSTFTGNPDPYYTYTIMDLDAAGNLIPGSEKQVHYLRGGGASGCYLHGAEFSPNGRYLYITHSPSALHPGYIDYVDCDNFIPGGQVVLNVLNAADFEFSQIELGIDGRLYLATNNRLSTLNDPNNPATSTWTDGYATGLNYPANSEGASITDPTYKLYQLPDQIDGMDYGASFLVNTSCCIKYIAYSSKIYEATVSATWQPGGGSFNPFGSVSGDVYIQDELRIPAGVNITIKNMNFYFAPDAKVVVEKGTGGSNGGRLTLDNTTLTVDNRCAADLMWLGVRVQGNASTPQGTFAAGDDGWLVMRNHSVVEHAITGAASASSPTGVAGTSPGGVIQAFASTFHNNVTDVEITNNMLSLNNQSRFVNTIFSTSSALNNTALFPKNHVLLNSVRNIRFQGCTFSNTVFGNLMQPSKFGTGIRAVNTKFIVEPVCTSVGCATVQRTRFENLQYGIHASASGLLNAPFIDRCDFENNYHGVYFSGVDFGTVIHNEFRVTRMEFPLMATQSYGLYLNSCTGYKVEGNHFTNFPDPAIPMTAAKKLYGIIVNNSGTDDNIIYRNTLNDLYIGGQSQGNNAMVYDVDDSPNDKFITGLEWKCNAFSGNIYKADLAVTSGYIDYEQGYATVSASPYFSSSPAGNSFSHNTYDPHNDIAVNSTVEPFVYYHHTDVLRTPQYYTVGGVAPIDAVAAYDSKSCPIKISTPKVTVSIPILENTITAIDGKTDSLRQKVDCGNSRDLMNYITGTHSAGSKKNRLLQCSPYLSDEVLTAYILSNPPAGHLSQVILANSPVSNTVADVLNAQSLPAGIAGNIQNAQTGISPMMYLNNEIGYLKKERWLLVDDMIRVYLNDSTFADPLREIELILNRERRLRRQEQLCDTRICLGDSTQAVQVKDSLQNTEGYYNYIRLAEVHLAAVNGCVCEALRSDSTLRSKVEYVAADVNDPVMAVRGEALLTAAFDTVFTEIVEELNPAGAGRNYIPMPEAEQPAISGFSVYPNPAHNILYLSVEETPISDVEIENRYTCTDAAGRTILSGTFTGNKATLDVTRLSAGVYTVTIRGNGAVHSAVVVIR